MDQDTIIRAVMIVGFLIVVPWAGYYRVRSKTKEKLDRMQEGLFILIGIRLGGLLSMGGVIVFLISPEFMQWSAVALPLWLRWTGVALGVCAGVLWIWTFRHLGKNLTDTVVIRNEHTFISSGPYRWVRHPFYVVLCSLFIANSLALGNWFVFLSGMAVFLLLVIRTKKEEANLVLRFGSEYSDYMKRVGRFFPKFQK
ncbi:MAG: isoprenylcysteine carboxylmethyltransferase family protein [bacterium]|nr:isoprenylcysteine carboxylmethyltransferase family protein [bacterium]